jgi:DNA topoisomerase-1
MPKNKILNKIEKKNYYYSTIKTMKPLIIVESPAKCKKIESFLDNKYKCIASFGHVRELKDGLKCIDIKNNFKPKFSLNTSNKNINKLRTEVKNASVIFLATDDDREGEAIAWHICQLCKLPLQTTKRIIFHEITKGAIQRALQEPTKVNMKMVNAQLSRVVLDRLVGFMISPILWKNINRKSGLSAGRCQTPALRLIYENQKQIDENPGILKYVTTGYFTKNNLPYILEKEFDNAETIEEFLEASVNHNHKFSKNEIKTVSRKPPSPLTTSSLQQSASTLFHYSPKATMKYAQTLYENGLITYMRTDSICYSKEFIDKAKEFITSNYDETYVNENIDNLANNRQEDSKSNKTKKSKTQKKKTENAQEAHEAIRPTNIQLGNCVSENIGPQEKKLYRFIWKNAVQSCMSDAKLNVLETKITAPQELNYKRTDEQINFPGWKVLDPKPDDANFTFLQFLKPSTLPYKKIKSVQTLKQTTSHIGEAKLVNLLEKKGIGRPSTFSSLISKIQERNYVKKENVEGKEIKCIDYELSDDTLEEIETTRKVGSEKNKLVLQQLGKIVIEFLLKHYDDLFSYDYTNTMETNLDKIVKDKIVWYEPCQKCYDDILQKNKQFEETSEQKKERKEKNKIDEFHSYVIGKYGPCIKCVKDGTTTFKKIKKGIQVDLDELKNGTLTLDDILETSQQDESKYVYKNKPILLKEGKYGRYASYDGKTYSLKYIKTINEKTLIDLIEGKTSSNPNVVRKINNEYSLRKGKFGLYIYHKTASMKKPQFISLKGCSLDPELATNDEYLEFIHSVIDKE